MTTVLAPVAGAAMGLRSVPDPVFSEGLVGPGMAIEPDREPGRVISPIAGTIVKLPLAPFAIVIFGEHPDRAGQHHQRGDAEQNVHLRLVAPSFFCCGHAELKIQEVFRDCDQVFQVE